LYWPYQDGQYKLWKSYGALVIEILEGLKKGCALVAQQKRASKRNTGPQKLGSTFLFFLDQDVAGLDRDRWVHTVSHL
jgi:hypothetical protein